MGRRQKSNQSACQTEIATLTRRKETKCAAAMLKVMRNLSRLPATTTTRTTGRKLLRGNHSTNRRRQKQQPQLPRLRNWATPRTQRRKRSKLGAKMVRSNLTEL